MADSSQGAAGGTGLRAEIELSWRRAKLFGVDPDSPGTLRVSDVDRTSRLMVAALPVLRRLAEELGDHPFSLMLADRDCHVTYQWSGERRLSSALESYGIGVGARLDEGAAGTNGLGTPLELGRGVAIHGAEHYLTVLKGFSCYGHPIRHPLTRRLEGVLDITLAAPTVSPLVGPLLSRAVADIEARIIEGARATDRRLFLAFQAATRRRSTPTAVLGGDIVLANRACLERLGSTDPSVLRVLTRDLRDRSHVVHVLDLGPSGRIPVEAERIDGTLDGVLFHLGEREPAVDPARDDRRSTPQRPPAAVLVAGEPGTGRSCTARELAGQDAVQVFDAVDALTGDGRAWVSRLVELAAAHTGTLVIEDVHLLDERALAVVRKAITAPMGARFVLTSAPVAQLPVHVADLVARCPQRVELVPLRDRVHELPALLRRLGAERRPDRELVFTPQALEVLGAQPWPGNLVELAQLVDELVARPLTDRVGLGDLPKRFRASARTTSLGGRERAERIAIITALREAGGNKRNAACELGMSRTTLYRKMRRLAVPEELGSS
ncbi:sigma-54-dependent Fis family transcriptional regulator [Pseudonocardia xishanensis]|uniref:Transcriptional regulator MimR n=1 Tax=Pseudonocardia xishanensis TaxID=630995 RepID=A0ABP8RXA9_9PSEU